jgi:hypothetical protein
MHILKLSFASLIVVSACASDPLDPGSGSSPGSGTGTLLVDGNATAKPRISNAKNGNDFDTELSVRVELNQQPVTTGTVTVRSRLTTIQLTYNTSENRWTGTAAGYDEVYQLDVTSGSDEVRGVIVDGPDVHTFTAPMAGASLDSTIVNTVTWSRGEPADATTFKAEETDRISISDTGSYEMPAGSLKAHKEDPRQNRIELRRANRIAPAGAVGGSDFVVRVDNMLDVVALPDPNQ